MLLVIGVIAAGCSATTTAHGSDRAPWRGRVIKIGDVYSATGTGATYGLSAKLGAELAARQIDAAGGIRGARLELLFRNDGSDPATSGVVTGRLIRRSRVLALLGPSVSNTAGPAHEVADRDKTVMMATSNTGPGIVGDCAYPCTWIFRDSLGEESAIPANIAEYAQDAHPSTAAILEPASGDTLGTDQAVIAQTALPLDGITLSASVQYPVSGSSLVPAVDQAIASHPDLLFVTGTSSTDLISLITDARQAGFLGKILGPNTFNSSQVSAGAGAAGLGSQSASAWFLANAFPANTHFVDSFESTYHRVPDQFAAQAYTGVELLASAVRHAHLTFHDLPADRRQILTTLADVNMETPLGPFSFTADHDVQQPIWIVQMNGQGGFNLVTSELSNPSG